MIKIERNQIELDGFLLSPFLENLTEFNCGEADLDDFFINDARRHEDQLLARTYALYVTSGKKFDPAALISFCNDSIRAESFANGDFKKCLPQLPTPISQLRAVFEGLRYLSPGIHPRVIDGQMKKLDRITIDSEICLGQPTIRGMRITVSVILKMLGSGSSIEDILDAYPELEADDIRQAIQYAAWLSSDQIRAIPL